MALAPATDLLAIGEYFVHQSPKNNIGLFPYVAFSIRSVFPELRFTRLRPHEVQVFL